MATKAPFVRDITTPVAPTAADATASFAIAKAPFGGTVSAASFTPVANMTGHNTNTRTITLVNKGQSGSGTTVIGTLAFVASNNGVAFDEKPLVLSEVEGATEVEAGDILAWVSTHAASGLADPGGLALVSIGRS